MNVFLAGTRLALLAWEMCTKEIVNVPAQQETAERARARESQTAKARKCVQRERATKKARVRYRQQERESERERKNSERVREIDTENFNASLQTPSAQRME